MKTFTLLATSMLFMHVMMAQPVLQNNLNFTIGDTYRINSYGEVLNIVPGPAGENMVWDFEVIEGEYYTVGNPNICVNPATTHFADSAAVLLSDIAIASFPSEPTEPYSYQYVKSGSTSRELFAAGMYLDGIGTFTTYNDAWVEIVFPLEYGDSYNFEVETLLFDIHEGYYYMCDSTEVTVEVDAWGSITTPAGMFPNVLRLKNTATSRSWMRFDMGESWTYLGEFTTISYRWFANNIKVPVMMMQEFEYKKNQAVAGIYPNHAAYKNPALSKNGTGETNRKELEYSALYLAEYNFYTGIDEIITSRTSIYPVPASDIVYISHNKDIEITEYRIYSIDGRLVSSSNNLDGSINVSHLLPGAYLLNLYATDTLVDKAKIVIHR
jgi:hypothetical protein